ncbi:hypothetical protein IWX64_002993 [Arthrobacter sp. CAN_A212]|uniref:hypothetical protein n=1 Tax=Arthrobacter sp. CAN_A212 TaxID=2787719 RepID=UPI0018CB6BF5
MTAERASSDHNETKTASDSHVTVISPIAGLWQKNRKAFRAVWSRSIALRRTIWSLVVLIGMVTVVVSFMLIVIPAALQWKSGQDWEDFGQAFATSPAAAGWAAVLAAVIAALTFNRGLRAERVKTAAESWWEKFEWVTDRVIPKDPKQERIAPALAADLLVSLSKMATERFQRDAVSGVSNHYLPGGEDGLQSDAPPRDIKTEARSFRNLADVTNSPAASNAALAAEYDSAGLRALEGRWTRLGELEIMPRLQIRPGHFTRPDALLSLKGRRIMVEFKSWDYLRPASLNRVLDFFELALAREVLTDLIVVSMAEIPPEVLAGGSQLRNSPQTHLIHWSNGESAEALVGQIDAIIESLPELTRETEQILQP